MIPDMKSQLIIHMGQYTCVSNDEWSPITGLCNERGKFPTRNLSQYEWGRGERKRMPFFVCLLGFSLSLSLSPFLSWGLRREEKRTLGLTHPFSLSPTSIFLFFFNGGVGNLLSFTTFDGSKN